MVLDELGVGGVNNINPAAIISQIATVLMWLFIILVLGVAIVIFIYVVRYNSKVIIMEKLSHGTFVDVKRCRQGHDRRDKGNKTLKLFIMGVKPGISIMPPINGKIKKNDKEYDEWYRSLWGVTKKGRRVIRMLKEGDSYTPVPFDDGDVSEYLQITKPVRVQWANTQLRENMELFRDEPSFMEKYGSYVMMGGTLMIIAIIFIFLFNKFETLEVAASAINNHADAMTEYVKALRELQVQPIK